MTVTTGRHLRRALHTLVIGLCLLALVLPAVRPQPAAAEPTSPITRLKATAMMVAEANVDRHTATIRPSPLYRDGMWLRDAFYITSVVPDAKLSQAVFEHFGSYQRDDGNIPNSIYWEEKDPDYRVDDSALFFLIWAYRDAAIGKVEYDRRVLDRALRFVLANMYEGKYVSPAGVSNSWLDTLRYAEPDVIAHNQGLLAVALRAARTLGLAVRDDEIAQAEAGYRSLYNAQLGYMPHSQRTTHRDPSVLVGEFMSHWLFGRALLAPEAVAGTIRNLAPTPAGFKNLATSNGTYLSAWDFQPPSDPGDYQNGASWFLYDFLALACGVLHDVAGARDMLRWRIEVELRPGDDLREYLQTNWQLPYYLKSPPFRARYGWNAFAIVGMDVLNRLAPGGGLGSLDAPVAVTNDDLPFLDGYRQLGGNAVLGPPLTGRFVWKGAVTQVFRGGVLAIHPGTRRLQLVNIFDEMSFEDLDDKLRAAMSTPRRLPDSTFEGTPAEQKEQRLALLEGNEAIKARYFNPPAGLDPETLYGLPTSAVEDLGDLIAIRTQRTVIQYWKRTVPWAKEGDTTVANAGQVALHVGYFNDWIPVP